MGYDVDFDDRRFVHAQDLVGVEVGLLNSTIFDGDVAIGKIAVVEGEARTVRHIFRRYLELSSLNLLLARSVQCAWGRDNGKIRPPTKSFGFEEAVGYDANESLRLQLSRLLAEEEEKDQVPPK